MYMINGKVWVEVVCECGGEYISKPEDLPKPHLVCPHCLGTKSAHNHHKSKEV